MRRVSGTGRSTHRTAARASVVASALAAVLSVSACTSGTGTSGKGTAAASASGSSAPTSSGPAASSPAAPASSSAQAQPAVITVPGGGTNRSPSDPVTVQIAHGRLASVTMTNEAGHTVQGQLAADGSSWRTAEDLGYSKTYRIVAKGASADGAPVTKKAQVTTLTPANMTMPYFDDANGAYIKNGATYGVGMVVRLHFDEAVDHKQAERTLSVTTTPAVTGGWYWEDGQDVYWRPKDYYPSGTKVSVAAKVYGKQVGPGLYGQADQAVSFTIGQKRVSIANAKTHHVRVFFDDKLVRRMPTSMGMGGTTQGKNGQTIYLWTMPGTYTVLTHENPAIMSSDSYGLPANSPLGYKKEPVYWSTKISTDGIYLHQLNTTVWAQGNRNVSHGCLNLNLSNAKWFYTNSRVGDVVKVVQSGGPALQFWQGGEWSVPWSQWVKGSAL